MKAISEEVLCRQLAVTACWSQQLLKTSVESAMAMVLTVTRSLAPWTHLFIHQAPTVSYGTVHTTVLISFGRLVFV